MAITLDNKALVTIYGGSGFIGRHVVGAIAKTGARMRVAVRRPELAGHLQPLGGVGQINAVQANVRYPESLLAAARGADAVINLVGILFPTGKQTFEAVQDEGARHVAEAARAEGARALVHVSAIGANAKLALGLRAEQGGRRGGGQRGVSRRRHPQALGRVRARRRFLQPLRRSREALPGASPDRRRQDQAPAGIRRRRGQGRSRRADRQGGCGRALRARRTRGAHAEASDGARADLFDAQALACADPVLARQVSGGLPATPAQSTAHHRPGAVACRPTMW